MKLSGNRGEQMEGLEADLCVQGITLGEPLQPTVRLQFSLFGTVSRAFGLESPSLWRGFKLIISRVA